VRDARAARPRLGATTAAPTSIVGVRQSLKAQGLYHRQIAGQLRRSGSSTGMASRSGRRRVDRQPRRRPSHLAVMSASLYAAITPSPRRTKVTRDADGALRSRGRPSLSIERGESRQARDRCTGCRLPASELLPSRLRVRKSDPRRPVRIAGVAETKTEIPCVPTKGVFN
jgi:hypothetical protein